MIRKFIPCVWCTLLLIVFFASPGIAVQVEGEWQELFNGEDLSGWTQRGGKAKYTVVDGCIVGSTASNTPNSFLCTDKDHGDFELKLEFKVDPELNSGVQIRSESKPDVKNGVVHGYQVEIDPSDRAWTAGIYDESRRGWLHDLGDNRLARYAFRQNDWNRLRILAIGDHIQTWLNDVPAADLHDSMTAVGFIALQVHGVGNRGDSIAVRWRNIFIRGNPPVERVADVADKKTLKALPVFPEPANIVKLADGFAFTEGPAIGPDGKVYFNDVPNSVTHVFDPESRETKIFRKPTGSANGLFWTPNDALISCEGGNRRVTRRWNGEEIVLAEKFDSQRLNSPNDLVLDGSGGIYFTDPRYGNRDDMELDVEGVYFISRDRKLTRVADDLVSPNGIILSPDNKTLYVADHADSKTWAWDVVGEGKIENKRKLADMGSDGMTIDSAGSLYLTWDSSIIVLSSAGDELARLKMPESPANCLLVGNTLYVTAQTGFYAAPTNRQGLADGMHKKTKNESGR